MSLSRSISVVDVTHDVTMLDSSAAGSFIDRYTHTPPRWLRMSKSIARSIYSIAFDTAIDVTLFTMAVAFLAFTPIVEPYNRVLTKDHPRAKEASQDDQKTTQYAVACSNMLDNR